MDRIVPIKCDKAFKKMFGDRSGISRLEGLLSIYLDIPYNELKGNVEIKKKKKRVNQEKEKKQSYDILAKIIFNVDNKINLEMNVKNYKGLIDRNIAYISHIFGSQMKTSENYSKVDKVIQINFNTFYVDEENLKIIDKYYIQNDEGNKLTKKLQIHHINIEECKKAWYNKDIEKYSKKEQEIIKIGALMLIDNINDFEECLSEVKNMNEWKKDIESTIKDLSSDEELLIYYDEEKDKQAIINSGLTEAEEKGLKEGIEKGKVEGKNERNKEIALKMLKENIDINLISKLTDLSINEISNLK